MNVEVRTFGIEDLRQRVDAMAEAARTSKVLRFGISSAMQVISEAQKAAAPIRKLRVKKRAFLKRLKRLKGDKDTFENVAKARKRSSAVQKKFRLVPLAKGQIGPREREEVRPGQVMRSIGYRVKVRKDGVVAKSGMNVGKRKVSARYAHHANIVGSMRHKPRYTKSGAYRGVMPDNPFIRTSASAVANKAIYMLVNLTHSEMARIAQGKPMVGGAK